MVMNEDEPHGAYAPEDGRRPAHARRVVAVAVPVLLAAGAIATAFVQHDDPPRTVAAGGAETSSTTTTTAVDSVLFEDPTSTTLDAEDLASVTSTSLRTPRPTVPKAVRDLVPTTITLPSTLPVTPTTAATACPPPPEPMSVSEPGVYTVAASGGDGRRIQPYPQGAGEPQTIAYSPDGRHLAITRLTGRADGEFTTLHLAAADGTGERELAPSTRSPKNPTWSPDGTRLALQEEASEPGQLATTVLHVATETLTRVAVHGYGVGFPRWSPDGRRLAWAGMHGPHGVFVADLGTNDVRRIDDAPTQGVSWSPDGSELAVARYAGTGGPKAVEVLRSDGSAKRVVHAEATRADWSSTDRSRLVTDTGGQLHLADPDGGGTRFIGHGHLHGWLPTGSEVVTTSSQGIHLLDVAGCTRTLVAGPADELALRSWAPDGKTVLFVRFR